MDEIKLLQETFDPDATPSLHAQQQARTALQNRIMGGEKPAKRRWRVALPIGASLVTATAVVAAFAISQAGHPGVSIPAPAVPQPGKQKTVAAPPYQRPANAAQYLENAAWSVEQDTSWVDPTPTQYMYVETMEMRNPPAYEQKAPNGALLPGKAQYRKIQQWDRVDGQVTARTRNGRLIVEKLGDNGVTWGRLPWSTIAKLTTPEAVAAYNDHPEGSFSVDVDAMAGQYVLPPDVRAAVYRYLAQQPGMKVNPNAVNIDGRPAIGLGRVLEGYLSQELLFDKETYALIGDRLVAVKDEVHKGDDGTSYSHKGDLFRQVIYRKLVIVDKPGDTT